MMETMPESEQGAAGEEIRTWPANTYQLFDNLIEGVQIIDKNWRYLYVNQALLRQIKADSDALTGFSMMEKYPGIEETDMFKALETCMEEKIACSMENEFVFPDQTRMWFKLNIQPVPEGVLISSHDITRLKQVEAELKSRLKEHQEMNARIREQKSQLEEFCHIIAHNMRAPLSNLVLLNDLVQKCADKEEQLLLVEKQQPVLDFLQETFDELVDAAQTRTDHLIKKSHIQLEKELKKVKELLQGEIYESKALIRSDFTRVSSCYYPSKYINSILFNLLSNALKYKSPDRCPEIDVFTGVKNGWIYLTIKDNGLGIDMERYGRKVFRLRKTFHNHPQAKGFGLFITKTQIEAMGGSIQLKSEPEKGSSFIIKLCKKGK